MFLSLLDFFLNILRLCFTNDIFIIMLGLVVILLVVYFFKAMSNRGRF